MSTNENSCKPISLSNIMCVCIWSFEPCISTSSSVRNIFIHILPYQNMNRFLEQENIIQYQCEVTLTSRQLYANLLKTINYITNVYWTLYEIWDMSVTCWFPGLLWKAMTYLISSFTGEWVNIYMCLRSMDVVSFHDFQTWYCTCSDS